MASLKSPEDVAAVIRARRKRLRLSQADLADAVGVSRQWIIETEKGRPGVAISVILRLLAALDLNLTVGDKPEAAIDSPREKVIKTLPPGEVIRRRPRTIQIDKISPDLSKIIARARERKPDK